jgi:hypothetical protein
MFWKGVSCTFWHATTPIYMLYIQFVLNNIPRCVLLAKDHPIWSIGLGLFISTGFRLLAFRFRVLKWEGGGGQNHLWSFYCYNISLTDVTQAETLILTLILIRSTVFYAEFFLGGTWDSGVNDTAVTYDSGIIWHHCDTAVQIWYCCDFGLHTHYSIGSCYL